MTTPSVERLLIIMETLRDPIIGCSWDLAQTPTSITPHTIEEAYEVVNAVRSGDAEDICDELGDLLFQVVFQAQMAQEVGSFDFHDIVAGLVRKLIRRHPHVFEPDGSVVAPERRQSGPVAIEDIWGQVKADEHLEKLARGRTVPMIGPLDGVLQNLPALLRAEKVSRKAAAYGFDWRDAHQVLEKVREEIDEVEQSLEECDANAVAEEIGDLLLAVANLARHVGIDPEEALHQGVRKFERRFTAMAGRLADEGRSLADADLAAMEAAWQIVKRAEA